MDSNLRKIGNHIEKLSNQIELPKEVTLGVSVITAIGNRELWIENYRGILECDEEKIVLLGKKGKISVSGKQLVIRQYTKEMMEIVGSIKTIEYL